jgi:hypothetical protein
MAITLAGAGLLFGSIALFEGVAAILEHIEGDPEADVQVALQRLAATNQRRAFAQAATEQAGAEHLQEKFAKFNQIPSRMLTQAAISRMPSPPLGQAPETGLLDMVSERLGVSPRVLNQVSSPSRMGDMGTIARQMGTSPLTPGQ